MSIIGFISIKEILDGFSIPIDFKKTVSFSLILDSNKSTLLYK